MSEDLLCNSACFSKKKKSKEGASSTTVMFVPRTPNGELAKRLKLMDTKLADIMQDKLKFVERDGMKLQNILHRLNPWENVKCSRKGCLICSNPDNQTFFCNKPSVTYKVYCQRCRQQKGKSDNDNDDLPDVDKETDDNQY